MARFCLASGSLFGFLSVALGAFAAHALKDRLSDGALDTFKTAAHYQMVHALALLILGVLGTVQANDWWARAGLAFILGIVLFSGSLYALALTGERFFGAITPIGGVAFLVGWILVGVGALRS